MHRATPTRRNLRWFLLFSALIFSSLLVQNFWSGGAQSSLTGPLVLPGDAAPSAAAGVKETPRIAKGANSYLAVWTDSRTILANDGPFTNIGFSGPYSGTGLGSMKDIYAARVGSGGQIIDTIPIIVAQASFNQGFPRVGWNGQNWLVTWVTENEFDRYTYEIRAARVSPAGQLLDSTSILLQSTSNAGEYPANVISDALGNWIVIWEGFSQFGGGGRSVFAARVSPAGAFLDRREIYQHTSQYLGDPDIARAGDRYLLTYYSFGPVMGVLLDSNLNQLRNGPEIITNGGTKPRVATDGNSWLVVTAGIGVNATFVSHDGDPVNVVTVTPTVGSAIVEPQACWDGSNWFVAYNSNYNAATGTYGSSDIYVTRVSAAGSVLDPQGIPVRIDSGSQISPSITPGLQGGAQVAWQEQDRDDVQTAFVSAGGVTNPNVSIGMGAPRQWKVRMATNGNGFLAVFRSDILAGSRILGQHLDVNGAPIDQQPFVIADYDQNNYPSIGWNGSDYLAVWDVTTQTGKQTYGRLVPAVGAPVAAPFLIMSGEMPDASGLNGQFLVTNIIQETSEIRRTQYVRVTAAGTPLGTPVRFQVGGRFNYLPRSAAFDGRWFAVWEAHSNHDDSPATTYGSFIEQDGTSSTPFQVGTGGSPHLAVAGNTGQALVVWGNTSVRARRINADGSSPEPVRGMAVSSSTALNGKPAVTWDGNQYVVTWIDQRAEEFPRQPRGDIFAARVSITNVNLEEIPVANFPAPEETPFVIASNGLTLFSYAKFYDNTPAEGSFAAHRITLRTARFAPPVLGTLPNAPSNLIVNQSSQAGVVLTWADNSNDEVGFKLESRTGPGSWSQIQELGADVTTASGISVSATEPTYFRLRAYNAAGDSGYSNEASAPLVTLSPFSPNTYNETANVQINATASDPEGIVRVEFSCATNQTFPNYTLLATDTTAPYSYAWNNVPGGYYYVKAKAYDTQGSTTETDYQSFVVFIAPTAQITSPANGAAFNPGSNITITADAQTHNTLYSDYLLRMDFYANSTLIGTVQGHYQSYNFTWMNVPTGAYTLTARPTSSLGLTGASAPVNVTVGNPGFNISGRVTDGTNGIYMSTTISSLTTGQFLHLMAVRLTPRCGWRPAPGTAISTQLTQPRASYRSTNRRC